MRRMEFSLGLYLSAALFTLSALPCSAFAGDSTRDTLQEACYTCFGILIEIERVDGITYEGDALRKLIQSDRYIRKLGDAMEREAALSQRRIQKRKTRDRIMNQSQLEMAG